MPSPPPRLMERDLRRAMTAAQALATHDSGSVALVQAVLEQLPHLVASDLTTLSLCDLRRGTRDVVGRPGESLSETDRSAFDRHFREHPLVRFHSSHPGGPTQRISDCLPTHVFRDSAIFSDYYRRIGIKFVMALPLRIDDASVISVVFNRSRSDFVDRERAMLDAIRRPLAALYRSLVAREEAAAGLARLLNLAVSRGWQIVTIESDDRIIETPESTRTLLRRFFGRTADQTLPPALSEWLRRSRNWGLDRLAAGEAFSASRGGLTLTVHVVPDVQAPSRAFLLMREEREALRPQHLAPLPLTPREREVLALVAAGKTNAEIGAILAVSARTAQKHLEHIFQKIGVETRMAAAVCAWAAAGPDREASV